MTRVEELSYKLAMSSDFICYLCNVLTLNLDKEEASKILADALTMWLSKTNSLVKNSNRKFFKEMSQSIELEIPEDDVIDILLDISITPLKLIQDEFINETLATLQKRVVSIKEE